VGISTFDEMKFGGVIGEGRRVLDHQLVITDGRMLTPGIRLRMPAGRGENSRQLRGIFRPCCARERTRLFWRSSP
jgi:hypothetical protein